MWGHPWVQLEMLAETNPKDVGALGLFHVWVPGPLAASPGDVAAGC